MKDRWGDKIMVAWAEHEMVWLRAAVSLPVKDRMAAYRDIASMSGRTITSVQKRAGKLVAKQRADAAILAAVSMPRRLLVPARISVRGHSQIKPPSLSRLMGAR